MKAISIRQPYAWLIINGLKPIENRNWPTEYRGRLLIHAASNLAQDAKPWPWPDIPQPDEFLRGGIIGEVTLVDCVTTSPSPWFTGPFGFVLRGAKPRPFKPCKGRSYIFEPSFTRMARSIPGSIRDVRKP